jgi:enolase-phosphatase E1
LNELSLIAFSGIQFVLLDIEGTVSDVRFVYDVMFPFARLRMVPYLERNWSESSTQEALRQVAIDAGLPDNQWTASRDNRLDLSDVGHHLDRLMASDSKSTGLKALQGLVWKEGFESGQLRAELFPDVLPAIEAWRQSGMHIYIYSSGSVLAQQLFFRHTTQGNISHHLSGYYDTTVGRKQESSSYAKIATQIGTLPQTILFVSDVAEELVAAEQAGMQVVASVRPNNKPLTNAYRGPSITSFSEIKL